MRKLLIYFIFLEQKLFFKCIVLLMFVLQIISFVIELIVIKYNLDDFHRIVTNFYNFFLCILCSLTPFFFYLLKQDISILKSILFDIVLQSTKQFLTILYNFFERVSLLDIVEQLC